MMNSKAIKYTISIVVWLIIWVIMADLIGMELFLPTPHQVLEVFVTELAGSKEFWLSIQYSILHIGSGFVLGSLMGIILAVLAFLWEWIEIFLWTPMKVIQSVPVASIVILLLLCVESSMLSVVIPFLVVLPILYTHTLTGIRQTDDKLLEMAWVFHVSPYKKIRYIYIPSLLPHVLTAASLAIGMAWKSGIAAEIIGMVKDSIGNRMYHAKVLLMTPELFAWTLVVICLSIICQLLVKWIAHRLLKKEE